MKYLQKAISPFENSQITVAKACKSTIEDDKSLQTDTEIHKSQKQKRTED